MDGSAQRSERQHEKDVVVFCVTDGIRGLVINDFKKAKAKKRNRSYCSIKYHHSDSYRMVGFLRIYV